DEHLDLLRGEHLVEAGLLDVEDLAAQRQDRLVAAVAALLRGAARRVALDDEELGQRRIALLAVGELAREPAPVERTLAPRELLRLAGRLPDARGLEALEHDPACFRRMLLEIDPEAIVHQRLDRPFHLAVAELGLGLALELRLGDLDADDRGEPLAHVVALERLVVLLED